VSQKIEAEASESGFLRSESPKNLLGVSRAGLGGLWPGAVNRPTKNRPTRILQRRRKRGGEKRRRKRRKRRRGA
jgi:hypothetical protein